MTKLQTVLETETHKIEVPAQAIINPKNHLLTISSQAFFRRLTSQERAKLRGSSDAIRDLKDDLDRGSMVELDSNVRALLSDSGLFSVDRVNELMVKGEGHEGRVR